MTGSKQPRSVRRTTGDGLHIAGCGPVEVREPRSSVAKGWHIPVRSARAFHCRLLRSLTRGTPNHRSLIEVPRMDDIMDAPPDSCKSPTVANRSSARHHRHFNLGLQTIAIVTLF